MDESKSYKLSLEHRQHMSDAKKKSSIDKYFQIYTKEQVDNLNVKEYKNNYFVNKQGKVYRIFIKDNTYYVKEIIPSISKMGYYQCGYGYLIHNMVAECFIGPRPKGMIIEHIDNNKTNNCVENLRYVTQIDRRQRQPHPNVHKSCICRYDYIKQCLYIDGKKTYMTPEQYIKFIIDNKGIEVAKTFIRKAKSKNIIIDLDTILNQKDIKNKEDNNMEINEKEIIGEGNSIIYLYYYKVYKDLAIKNDKEKFLCRIGYNISDDTSKIFAQSYKFMPEYPELALIIKTNTPNELLTTIQFILKNRTKQPENVTDSSWILTNPKEVKDIYNLIIGK